MSVLVAAKDLPQDPLSALRVLTEREHELERIRREQVVAARAAGASWQQIGAIQRGASYRIVESWLTGTADFEIHTQTRDPNDDYLIALARTNDVEFIVSGDKDLLEWETQQPPVMTPRFEQRSRTT